MNALYKLHKKFDNIKEPNRLLCLIVMVLPALIIPVVHESVVTATIGIMYLLLMLASRLFYLGRKRDGQNITG